jgi:Uma2 family endonuclease
LYLPPCSDVQQDTVTDVVITVGAWVRAHPGFVLGTNEAGMRLAGATRAADAAVWRRSDVGAYTGGLRRQPPALAVEVAGADDEEEAQLREKARWYLDAGVTVVWLVLPEVREVVVLTTEGEGRFGVGQRLPGHAALPGLEPVVDDLFRQISGG